MEQFILKVSLDVDAKKRKEDNQDIGPNKGQKKNKYLFSSDYNTAI